MSFWSGDRSIEVVDLTVGGLLRAAAADSPDQLALVEGVGDGAERRRWTYRELSDECEALARALLGRFEPGERVAVWAPNLPEWIMLEFAAGMAGLVLVTVNPAYRPKELVWVLSQSGASGIILVPSYRGNAMAAHLEEVRPELERLREVIYFDDLPALMADRDSSLELPEVSPDDPAQIQYTSGTTGFAKGALLHHRGIVNNSNMFTGRLEMEKGDVYINPMPLFHTGGCVQGALGCVWRRAAHVLVSPGFDPTLMLDLVEQERGSIVLGVPTMLMAMLDHPSFPERDLSSVKAGCTGGATVPPELVRRVEREFGMRLAIVYGQTEASPVITQTKLDDQAEDKYETVGQPLPQVEIKVSDPESGEPVPIGTYGEFCARGYQVMLGYYGMPEKTADTIDSDGWLHTGDLSVMDDRGYFKIVGRLRDMIIRGGENIYPREIEELLLEHPQVADAAVVGLPDPNWGEIVGAFICREPGSAVSESELFEHVRAHLAPHKTPRVWEFVTDFPMTPSGKVQKYVLVENHVASARE